ncbi:hypothetical protein SARC_04657 [Sphaeroforma arctica JP610]|uniref:Uncharacterized protein n=1 Tax=Sphaeroforma arctica JP610 TaxID=667725 RepID=A0A0L0G1Y8_9EUKA|nr:hypothetical protein SARC_04657 [Sphaeroforma arctica JP610]KNC83080.1 hypothetical protein SARC_04657 [Sphaeroforma arctica JP610]|eukprot:XP_014156982.1 hypothetical protein SARC_04657 [Sphaeroforma arctica JP610]
MDSCQRRSFSKVTNAKRGPLHQSSNMSHHKRKKSDPVGEQVLIESDFDELELMGGLYAEYGACTRKSKFRMFPIKHVNSLKQTIQPTAQGITKGNLPPRRTVRFADYDEYSNTYPSNVYDRTGADKIQVRDTREAVILYCELMLFKLTEMSLNPESTNTVALHYGQSGSAEARWKEMVVSKIIMSMDVKNKI